MYASIAFDMECVMSSSVNKVILVGNLGRDPEIRSMQDGSKVASFSLATSEVWKDKQTGERKDRTEWHRVVVFNGNLVDIIEKYVRKGTKLYVEGQLQTRKWQDKDGIEKYTTEIVLSRFRGEIGILSRSDDAASDSINDFGSSDNRMSGSFDALSDLDDDIPF